MMNLMTRCLGASCVALSLLGALPANSAVLFQDSFESTSRSLVSNLISWGGSTDNVRVSNTRAKTGSYSLQFPFAGVPLGSDSFEEQRINFGKAYSEIWVKYDLYVPSNYYHRSDGASNNKFFAAFNNDYSPGYQVNFSLAPISGGGSKVEVHYYRNGTEQAVTGGATVISSADLGKWHRIVMHFKVPTSLTSTDGVQELWKNGQQIYSIKNQASNGTTGLNYIDEAYILGWANSGFNELTVMYVDDVVVSDTPIALTDGPVPNAPVLNTVQ
jgi:hypothetical protein